MKKLIVALSLAAGCISFGAGAEAATYSAKPVEIKFMRMNLYYLDTFFSFYRSSSGSVVLRITVNTLLSRGETQSRSGDTSFSGAHLELRNGRVFLNNKGSSTLIAHEMGGLGGWKMDDARLKFMKKIAYGWNSVTVTPVLLTP